MQAHQSISSLFARVPCGALRRAKQPALGRALALGASQQTASFSSGSPSGQKPDYIIVGAGSAGCAVAHRLAEAGEKVMLVEAGRKDRGDWDFWKIHMPAALAFNVGGTKYNWDFYTVPQKGLNNRVLHEPRGKVVGGSSAINAMAYVRGHAEDFERWGREVNNPEWGYKYCLPYFKKAQRHELGENEYRGGSGPLAVCQKDTPVPSRELNQLFQKAGSSIHGYVDDPNGYKQEGFGPMDMTVNHETGERETTANAYLNKSKYPFISSNVELKTVSLVTGLVFDDADNTTCRGIRVESGKTPGEEEAIFAEKEVILCAGAVGSTQILQLSGIGNADYLKGLDIASRVHNPDVGENMEDHLEFYLQYLCTKPISLYPYASTFTFGAMGSHLRELSRYAFRQPHKAALTGLEWLAAGRGVGATNHFESGGFLRTRSDIPHPDVQFHFIPGCVVGQLDFLPQHGYQAHVGCLRPSSKGWIRILSKDPHQAPEITPEFLTTEKDVVDQRAAFRKGVEVMESPVLDEVRGERYNFGDVNIDNDAEVDDWIRENSHSGYHLSCTNKMGKVVSEKTAEVYGCKNLRVIDASIFPSMSSGNLNSPTIMTAEKMADAVLGKKWEPVEVDWFKALEGQSQ